MTKSFEPAGRNGGPDAGRQLLIIGEIDGGQQHRSQHLVDAREMMQIGARIFSRRRIRTLLIERVRILYLNARNMLIRNEPMSEGSVDEAAVYVREVIRRALEYHATAMILVHNHPSGDPQPSQQDIRLTREIIEAARPLGISVHDHVVVGARSCASMRSLGLL